MLPCRLVRSNTSFHPPFFQRISDALDSFFHFKAQGSSLQTELLAGLTTFSTISYILVVNPMIMAMAPGMNYGALVTATAVVGAIFTIMMGLWTNYPLAMAPAMGINAMLAIQVCKGMGVPWQAALGLVFYSGIMFFLLSVTGLRKIVIEAFPDVYKKCITAGIGVFIAFIGLRNAGVIVSNPVSYVALGDMTQTVPRMAFFGIILTVAALYRKIPGALIGSIVILTILGLFLKDPATNSTVTTWPTQVFAVPNSMAPLVGQLDLAYFWHHPIQCIPVCLAILFGDLFSAVACLLGIGQMAGLNDENGNLPKMSQALAADSTAAMGGAILGTNTPIIYLESAAGVEQGGRTGLVSIVVAICYLLSLFITPLIKIVPQAACAPALVIVGILAAQGLAQIDWRDLVVASTAILTIVLMAMGSASDGVALGFIVCVGLTLLVGKGSTIKPAAYVVLGIFLILFVIV